MVHPDAAKLVALLALLGLSLVPSGSSGSLTDPEITDPANDQTLLGAVPISQQPPAGTTLGLNSDILFAWVEELGDNLQFTIDVQGTAGATSSSVTTWTFHFEIGTTGYDARASQQAASPVGTGATAPGGVSSAATAANGVVIMTVPKSAVGNPASGTSLTNLFATATAALVGQVNGFTADRAPNAGAGRAYVLSGGAGGNGTGNGTGNVTLDADADGLTDEWELEHFGNITLQNGTGDPDVDRLNNTAEFQLGTDPNEADTDGDDVKDGDDPAPLDPNVPPLTNTTDRDNDTLPDMWERQHFNNTAEQNATGDPDQDTLNNSAELQRGTDPTRPDTDGDGVPDATDVYPTDATKSSDATGSADANAARPELYSGAAMFAAAATFCLLGLARRT